MNKQPVNENIPEVPDAKILEPLVVGPYLFRMILTPDNLIYVNEEGIKYFFSQKDLSKEMVQKVKDAVVERIDAWTKHQKKT